MDHSLIGRLSSPGVRLGLRVLALAGSLIVGFRCCIGLDAIFEVLGQQFNALKAREVYLEVER